jgi:hypothetical protein
MTDKPVEDERMITSVVIDDEPAVCMACAERCANDSRYPRLFWLVNFPQECDGQAVCPDCRQRMDSQAAHEAVDRIVALLEGRSE